MLAVGGDDISRQAPVRESEGKKKQLLQEPDLRGPFVVVLRAYLKVAT